MNENKNRLQAIDDELVQAASLVHRRNRPMLKRRVVDEGLATLLDSDDGRLPQEASPVASVGRKLAR